MLRDEETGKFEDNWYKPFTTCLTEKSFEAIKPNTWYLCVIKQIEKYWEMYGERMKYEKGDRIGEDIILVEPQIVQIYPADYDKSKIEIDYLKLYKAIK